jgi:DNA-binding NarL/FixJ family response regulator/signal transduction histidine kinase
VLINRQCQVLSWHGALDPYLTPPGGPSRDLIPLARRHLRSSLRAVCCRAIRGNEPASDDQIVAPAEEGARPCTITVRPVVEMNGAAALLVVAFQERPPAASARHAAALQAVAEDRRIGRELHDGVQQEIAALELFARALRDALDRLGGPDEAVHSARRAAQTLCDGLATTQRHVRQLAHDFLAVPAPQELTAALAQLARTLTEGGSVVRCRFEAAEPVAIPDAVSATHLYRSAQEAVTNALRHSRADAITISLARHGSAIVLEVRDNGVGLAPTAATRPDTPPGAGLRAMEYRAGLIGAALQVERSPEAEPWSGACCRRRAPEMRDRQQRARILIVDDHPLFREGLALRISAQPDLEVCGEAATEPEGLAQVLATEPDLVIVDLALREGHGFGLLGRIRSRHPAVKTLVVSAHDESFCAHRCLHAGAMGYLGKHETGDQLIHAIRTVLRGERYLSPAAMQRAIGGALARHAPALDPVEQLSNRELEVFQRIGHGETTSGIARGLGLSVHTIETHREKIRRKLGVRSGAELAYRAIRWMAERPPA